MLRRLRRIFLIINLKTLIVMALAVLSTYICQRYRLTAGLPLTLIATAVVFPVVFSIGGAYKRRENALAGARGILGDLLGAWRKLFADPIEDMPANEEAVYLQLSKLSRFIREDPRHKGLPTGEVSRCNQYLSKMIIALESIKHVYQYRTPRTLRAFSDFFIVLLPVIYGPHFAQMARESAHCLHFIMPVLLSLILVSLDNIQDHLENPVDQIGEDDVAINAEKFVQRLEL